MVIKNIVFDIGNVLLKWQPIDITTKTFPNELNPHSLARKIFESSIWLDLNRGKITEKEAIILYYEDLNISIEQLNDLLMEVKRSLTPIDGSIELLNNVYDLGMPLYSITDNVREIVSFLKQKYNFFEKFIDIIVSAELGLLKPSKDIYLYLINKYKLIPEETVFIDDLYQNIEGAKAVGMHGIHFTTANKCREALKSLSIKV
ncbi:HAD family hydrolase [Candidatus Tisiphia endosymbiont of Nemotelus uliginosus]|uniref:HAD family hydrolase n=1 Tax=Candidatus Tisiphia endosymbiont of Nemotelus uliginosus TaxID=3077926 RepID=UPI0035C92703